MLTPFKLSDGRSLYLRETNAGASHWVVFLPGSSAELWDFTWAEQRALLEPLHGRANLLQINKPGIREDGLTSALNSALTSWGLPEDPCLPLQ